MKLSNVRQIIAEDFQPEDRDMVSRLGGVLNYFMRQVVELSDANIDFDNLAFDILNVEVTVDTNGIPLQSTRFNSKVSNPRGLMVINASNLTNSVVYPTSNPFITFTPQGGGIIKIDHISGLVLENKYRLVIIAV